MSKGTRIALAAVVSLVLLIAVFVSAGGAPISAQPDRAGSHLVSGAKVNLDHYREAAPAPAPVQSQFESGKGHGCESESQQAPLD